MVLVVCILIPCFIFFLLVVIDGFVFSLFVVVVVLVHMVFLTMFGMIVVLMEEGLLGRGRC